MFNIIITLFINLKHHIIDKTMPQLSLSLFLLIIISAALYLAFSNTRVSPLTFLFGGIICLIVELVLLCVYSFYKFHQIYRQSHTIRMNPRNQSQMDLEKLFPFEKIVPNQAFYFNKYTDQAKLVIQKQQLKTMQLANQDEFYFQEFQIDQPKKETMAFLKQIQSYENTLNTINHILVSFGQDLKFIEKGSIFSAKKYQFAQFQKVYPPESPINQLTARQNAIFLETKTKLLKSTGTKDNKLLFPSWSAVIDLLKFIGNQFLKIETMRRSNSQMLAMIHKRIKVDFELLEKKLITIGSELNQSIKTLNDLQKDHSKYRDIQFNAIDTNQLHLQMMQWFKKQIYEFRDLQKRIKETEFNLKQKTAQKKYCQQKIALYKINSKKQFIKNVKYCFIAFLDSYHITVDQSIKKIQQSFCACKPVQAVKAPLVKNFVGSTNLNQALEAEKLYQKQYFERVNFYLKMLDDFIVAIETLGDFLKNLKSIFGESIKNLQAFHLSNKIETEYFTNLTIFLLERSGPVFQQLKHLIHINKKFQQSNVPSLEALRKQINKNVIKSTQILSQIRIGEGPIQYKYNSARGQLQSYYSQIEQKLKKLKQFQSLYLLHSGRIKKILITELMDFFSHQLKKIDIGKITNSNNNHANLENTINNGNAGLIQEGSLMEKVMEKVVNNNLHQELAQENDNGINIEDNNLETNRQLSPMYLKFLNQFLFVCYTQWKTSNFFKSQLQKQLFIAFNKEPNESFSKIQVSEMEFEGLPPEIIWLKELQNEDKQAFFDVNLAFKGSVKFKVNTIYKLIRDIPVEVVIQIQQFYCVMRFCFVPSDIGKGWFSFIGEPISKFKIVPSIANYRFDIDSLRNMFNNFLLNKLKKHTHPIKQAIFVPASKKDNDLEMIQKRFKVIQDNQGYR